jgi:hypothetical protein
LAEEQKEGITIEECKEIVKNFETTEDKSSFTKEVFTVRAEDRIERTHESNRREFRESPRKRAKNENDLRSKPKKTLKKQRVTEDGQVKLMRPKFDMETDIGVLKSREKQISYGKNTMDYNRYNELVARSDRKDRMPRTPHKNKKYSRRQWDGLVKNWKQQIHATVNTLEGVEEEMKSSVEPNWKLDGRLGSSGSWAEEVESEDFRLRARSSASLSSDQGLGVSMSSSGATTPRDRLDSEEIKDPVFEICDAHKDGILN